MYTVFGIHFSLLTMNFHTLVLKSFIFTLLQRCVALNTFIILMFQGVSSTFSLKSKRFINRNYINSFISRIFILLLLGARDLRIRIQDWSKFKFSYLEKESVLVKNMEKTTVNVKRSTFIGKFIITPWGAGWTVLADDRLHTAPNSILCHVSPGADAGCEEEQDALIKCIEGYDVSEALSTEEIDKMCRCGVSSLQ